LSGRGLCDELITRPEESYRLCCVVMCDLETSRMGAPYIYDISNLRVKVTVHGLMGNILHKKIARLDTANSVMPYAKFPSAAFQVYETCPIFVYVQMFRCLYLRHTHTDTRAHARTRTRTRTLVCS